MNQIGAILLTVYLEEGFYTRIEGQGFDKKRPREFHEYNGKVVKSRFPGVRDYKSDVKHRVRITTVPEETIKYFISDESCPREKCTAKFDWKKWSPMRRCEWHLANMAEGKRFEYSFVTEK